MLKSGLAKSTFELDTFEVFVKLSEYINSILVLCSHDRSAIKEFCNKILVLNNGKQEYFGNIEDGYKIYDKLMGV